MWGKLTKMLDNIIALDEEKLTVTVFHDKELQRFIVRLNTQNQLFKQGVASDDRILGVYSYATQGLSGGKKKYGERYNLFDTGKFYESFRVIVYKDGFTIEADTMKEDKDLLDYGPVLGLTEESKNELSEKMLPLLIAEIRKEIFK